MRIAWLPLLLLGCAAPQPPCPCATAARPVATPTCPSSAPSPTVAEPAPMPTTCGGLALREARLVAAGKGDKHPDLLAVRQQLANCSDRTPTAAECGAVWAEGAQLETMYGPNHPLRIINAAQKALCPAPNAPPTTTATVSTPPPDFGPPSCSAGKAACGSGPHAACCGSGETCCAGGAAGNYYCKKGKGPCPPLP